ncbi:hypothetical protein ACFV9C_01305 [Kribbella sp. NPDC059898]|uniref:hypothetical protein n=1 Tax=Kribbella sp. NPDC059898 TaxID=3346995 RepID=UPI00365402BD
MAIARYWLTEDDGPFAAVLNVLEAFYHPGSRYDNFEVFVQRARAAVPEDVELANFRRELVQLLQGEREGLHPKALATAAAYDQRNDDEFPQWLWCELYPSEPLPRQS